MKILNSAKSGESLFIEPSFVWHKATTMKRDEDLGRLCYANLPTTKANLTFIFSYRYLCRSSNFKRRNIHRKVHLCTKFKCRRDYFILSPHRHDYFLLSSPFIPSDPPIRLFPPLIPVRSFLSVTTGTIISFSTPLFSAYLVRYAFKHFFYPTRLFSFRNKKLPDYFIS